MARVGQRSAGHRFAAPTHTALRLLTSDRTVTDNPPGLPVPPSEEARRTERLKTLLDSLPSSYAHYPMKPFAPTWDIDFPHRTNVMVPIHTVTMLKLASGRHRSVLRMCWWSLCATLTMLAFWLHCTCTPRGGGEIWRSLTALRFLDYFSLLCRTNFHRHVDAIYEQVLPTDKYRALRVAKDAVVALCTGKSINKRKKEE